MNAFAFFKGPVSANNQVPFHFIDLSAQMADPSSRTSMLLVLRHRLCEFTNNVSAFSKNRVITESSHSVILYVYWMESLESILYQSYGLYQWWTQYASTGSHFIWNIRNESPQCDANRRVVLTSDTNWPICSIAFVSLSLESDHFNLPLSPSRIDSIFIPQPGSSIFFLKFIIAFTFGS